MKIRWLVGVALAALTHSAEAADLSRGPAFKAPAAAAYDWTGFYLGLNAGLGVAQSRGFSSQEDGAVDRGGIGFAGGVQAGFNWQFSPSAVAGIEGDVGYLGISRSFLDLRDDVVLGARTSWYGTVRGRLGYASGPSLFYATGGAAFVNVKNSFDDSVVLVSKSETSTGWTIGGGIETALGGNWSGKAEYLYIDAGRQDVFNPDVDGGVTTRFDNHFHVYRYGLNYKFGAPTGTAGAATVHDWTGFYVGVNAGAALSQDAVAAPTDVLTDGNSLDIAGTGFAGGGQAGFNWQFSPQWVGGIEGDIGYLGIDRSFPNFINGSAFAFGLKTDWYGTLRGRIGYSTGPALLYVTGGGAFVHLRNNADRVIAPVVLVSKSETAAGWTVGGGIEAALNRNWTAKTEYLYIDAGSQDLINADMGNVGRANEHFDNRFHVFRFGLNYSFGG